MSKSSAVAIVFAVLMGLGAILVARQFRQALDSPAGQRFKHRATLEQMASALRAYRDRHQALPANLFQLFRDQRLPLGANRGYAYRQPPAGAAADYVVMWSEAYHRAVAAGEPWGEGGAPAERDHPAVAYVLDAALVVEELSLEECARRAPVAPSIPAQ